ncbi:signaling protein (plasmid) [Peptoclostridium acidaminophilum DSM 3953]|uniref:Signaling protein n=1 Tax=Peptoclostridium acidaminophilum DSM 3953 TaxID=1286171 RepID=W8TP01_PEPAC|nr:diguanylate cyclase [Peptoclostridium acidaminophilum]AHM57882.1 signaling protein [Peptoclostridium acidaminophilum DSM 3953]
MDCCFYKSILDNSPMGYAYHRIICDESGVPTDYEFIEVNPAFEKLTGLMSKDIVGKKVTEVIPDIRNSDFDFIKYYGGIALYGGCEEIDQFSEPLRRWYRVKVFSPEKNYFVTCISDISKEMQKIKELDSFFSINIDLLCIADLDGTLLKVNKEWEYALGYSVEELEGSKFLELVHPEDVAATLEAMSQLSNQNTVLNFINRYRRRDGEYRYIEWRSKPHGRVVYAAARDITARIMSEVELVDKQKQLEEANHMLKLVLDTVPIGIFWKNSKLEYLGCNRVFSSIAGLKDASEIVGLDDLKISWSEGLGEVYRHEDRDIIASGESKLNYEVFLREYSGEERWIRKNKVPITDRSNVNIGILGTYEDITEKKRAEEALRESERKYRQMAEELEKLANYDKLTKLPNRRLFFERLKHGIREAKRDRSGFALMFVDLDGFKSINDNYGHEAGDDLLKEVGRRLSACVRESDTVARIGGDEFTVIARSVAARHDAAMVAHKIIKKLEKPFKLKEQICSIGASVGIALYPENGFDSESLLKNSDRAMYEIKRSQKGTYCFFDQIRENA